MFYVKQKLSNFSKRYVRNILAWLYYVSGSLELNKGKIIILMYHRVLSDDDPLISLVQPGMYVTKNVFDMQINYISKHYSIISLDNLLDIINGKTFDKNKKYCVITFDDGWLDNYINAYPVLKKHNAPATIFLTTSLIGTEEWFWPDKVKYLLNNISFKSEYHSIQIKNENIFKLIFDCIEKLKIATVEGRIKLEDELINKLKECEIEKIHSTLAEIFKLVKISLPIDRVLLNWDEVRTMSNKNITFGSHTCNHKILTILNEDEIKKELKDSKDKLKYEKVSFTPVFCYPNGNYNNIVQKLVKDAGYSAAVTTKFGAIEIATLDKYSLNRIGIHNDVSLSAMLFSFHLSGIWQRLKYKSKR